MNPDTLRRVPWKCEWGRFGLTAEQITADASRVDGVFWACHHPGLAPDIKLVGRRECETCPVWTPAARLVKGISA